MTRSRTQLCATLTLLATSLVGQGATSQPRPKLELEEIGNWRMAGGTTFSMAFDPTGCFLASGGEQGEVLLWDWKKRKIRRRYKKEETRIGTLRFSPDGKQLALMGSRLRVLDPGSGRDLFSHTGGGLHGLAYDTKGKRLAYAAGNGTVTVLDTQTWKPLRSFRAHKRLPVRSLCFGPKDAVIFAGTSGGHIWRLDLASGEETHEETLASTPQGLTLLPDGRLVIASWNGILRIGKGIRVRNERPLQEKNIGWNKPARKETGVYEMAVDPGRGRIALGGGGSSPFVSLWDTMGLRVGTLLLGKTSVSALTFAPSGELLVGTYAGRILVFDKGQLVQTLGGQDSKIQSLAFSRDGRHVAISGRQTRFIDLESRESRSIQRTGSLFTGRLAHEVGMLTGWDVQFLDCRKPAVILSLPVKGLSDSSLATLSRDRKWLAIGGDCGLAAIFPRILDLSTGKTRVLEDYWSSSTDLVWESESKSFLHTRIFGDHQQTEGSLDRVSIDGSHQSILKRPQPFHAVALSPDGRWILTISGGGTEFVPQDQLLERIDAKTGKVQADTLSKVWWLRYIGKDLFLAHDGQQLSLWDPHKLEKIQVLHKGGISLARLSPEKKRVALVHGSEIRVFRLLR